MGFLNLRQVNAYWVLGWALAKHVVARPFVGRPTPTRWLERLRGEELGPVPQDAWGAFAGAGRCLGCGLCDAVGEPGDTPSAWLVGAIRQPSDAPLSVAIAERLTELAPRIAAVCPARVSVLDVVRLVRGNLDALGRR